MTIFDLNSRLGGGVNIIGYDPLWRDMEMARFRQRHFSKIREAGFRHVRINLHPFGHMDSHGQLSEVYLQKVDWAVKGALDNGLMAILDFHEYNAMGQDPGAGVPRLLAFWRQVARRYRDESSELLFEVLNEPHTVLTKEYWNEILPLPLDVIRQSNPDRGVIIGPGDWNAMDALPSLEIPESDRNIIVTVHYYLPMAFTHQGARWTPQFKDTGITWMGTVEEKNAMAADFAPAAKWAKDKGRPVYLGEFGAYDKGDMDSRARYTSAVARIAESHGWSWGYWQFDSDFLLWDMEKDGWVEPILRALLPE